MSLRALLATCITLACACGACGDGAHGPTTDAGSGATIDAAPDPDPALGHWSGDFALPGLAGPTGTTVVGASTNALAIAPNGDVYLAGTFDDVAGVPAVNIARWNGTDWAPVGAGLPALHVDHVAFDAAGKVWATLVAADTNMYEVWRFDDPSWVRVGTAAGAIKGIAPVDNDMVIVGGFGTVDGVAHPSEARHTPAGWVSIPTFGIHSTTAIAPIAGGFCIAGSFDAESFGGHNVACFDGTAWFSFGTGFPTGADVLVQGSGGVWYAGGNFDGAVVRFSPDTHHWDILGGGVVDFSGVDPAVVSAIREWGDDVLVGGTFTLAGGTLPALGLARWSDANGWRPLGGNAVSDGVQLRASVNAIVVDASGAWIGGTFARIGTSVAIDVARVTSDGIAHPVIGPHATLGVGGDGDARTGADVPGSATRDSVNALAYTADDRLIAAGAFSRAGTSVTSNAISLANGAWTDLQGSTTDTALGGIVFATIVRADGTIVVAGDLRLGIDQYAVLQHLPTGWAPLGPRVQGIGRALLEHDGAVWLGGDFFSFESTEVDNLLRFDGTSWVSTGVFDDFVYALAVYEGDVVAGGAFSHIDGQSIVGLARRHAGAWERIDVQIGSGATAVVETLAVSPTLGLVIGGTFTLVGGTQARSIAYYDGAAWHELGGGLNSGASESVIALAPYRQGIFAAGSFRTAGDNSANQATTLRIAWFDGQAWIPLADGVNAQARALQLVGRTLYVGGQFHVAGARGASGIAAWQW